MSRIPQRGKVPTGIPSASSPPVKPVPIPSSNTIEESDSEDSDNHAEPEDRQLGPSLLDKLKERTNLKNKTFIISQIVLVSALGAQLVEKQSLLDAIQGEIEHIQERKKRVHVSGCLLVYENHLLLSLECSPDAIGSLLTKLESLHRRGWLLNNTKVLLSNELRESCFPSFQSRIISADTTQQQGEFTTTESTTTVAAECCSSVVALGKYIKKNEENSEDWELYAAFPNEGMVKYLLERKELETFSEHSRRQLSNLDLVLEGEVTWPMAERQYPYQ
eukprot:m.341017 g.341017  ORF g.341017 m.341017 type:complete len:276 (+) comp19724_c0_seq1:42-869(+)